MCAAELCELAIPDLGVDGGAGAQQGEVGFIRCGPAGAERPAGDRIKRDHGIQNSVSPGADNIGLTPVPACLRADCIRRRCTYTRRVVGHYLGAIVAIEIEEDERGAEADDRDGHDEHRLELVAPGGAPSGGLSCHRAGIIWEGASSINRR